MKFFKTWWKLLYGNCEIRTHDSFGVPIFKIGALNQTRPNALWNYYYSLKNAKAFLGVLLKLLAKPWKPKTVGFEPGFLKNKNFLYN